MLSFNQIVWLDIEIFPKNITSLHTSSRVVLSERMIIEDTRSYGRLKLHLFEKVWPRLDNVILNDCCLIRYIEKLISEINKVSSSFRHNQSSRFVVEKSKYSKRMRKLNVYHRMTVLSLSLSLFLSLSLSLSLSLANRTVSK